MTTALADAAPRWVQARIAEESGPPWLIERRRAAGARVLEDGFPTRKVEQWRFTPLDRLLSGLFEQGSGADTEAAGAPEGVYVGPLADTPEAERYLGRVALEPGPFGDVNTALFRDGLLVRIGKGVSLTAPLQLDLEGPDDGASAIHPRILIVAEEASSVRIVERHSGRGGTLTNAVTEVVVGPGASVEHLQVRRPRSTGMHVGSLAVRVDADGSYASRVIAVGGRLSRLDLHVDLAGKGASCTLDGLYVVAADEHVDHHTVIDHTAPHTTSVETYKGIVAGQAVAVFDGKVRIHRDAQNTSASQQNRNLLLSDEGTVHTKPSLIIDADSVTAAHGATVGRLDDEALFYLRSRGVGAAEARAMLIHAFAREVLDPIQPPELAEQLLGAVLARLP